MSYEYKSIKEILEMIVKAEDSAPHVMPRDVRSGASG